MIWPVDVRTVTQEFAAYPNPDYQPDGHTGMDFGVNVGTPIRAAGAGTVLWADWAQGLGWPNPYYIAIDFDGPWNGDQSAGILVVIDHGHCATLYAHLDQTGLNPGDPVREGEVIGQTGNTGRSSGPHLHFEVLPDGWDVNARWYGRRNPRDYIKGAAVTPQSAPAKDWFDMATEAQLRKIIREENPWGYNNPKLEKDDAYALLRAARTYAVKASADAAAVRELVAQLASKQGVTIDYAKVDKIVKDALAAGVTVDVNVNSPQP